MKNVGLICILVFIMFPLMVVLGEFAIIAHFIGSLWGD